MEALSLNFLAIFFHISIFLTNFFSQNFKIFLIFVQCDWRIVISPESWFGRFFRQTWTCFYLEFLEIFIAHAGEVQQTSLQLSPWKVSSNLLFAELEEHKVNKRRESFVCVCLLSVNKFPAD